MNRKEMSKKLLSMLLILTMLCGLLQVAAFAETAPADDAVISITVSDQGVLAKANDGSAMVGKSVTVKDINSDGKLTVDEALIAAHAAFNSEGGYAASDSGYGLTVTKLWGKDTYNTLFFVNGIGLSSGVGTDTVKAGDVLFASVNKDDTYYADWYTAFDKASASVTAGEELTLTLTGGQGMCYPADFSHPVKNVKIGTWNNGAFEQLGSAVTDDDGQVTLTFPTAGTYLVTASGTVKDQVVTDWTTYATEEADCPIMAPVCIVTVQWNGSGTAEDPYLLNGTADLAKLASDSTEESFANTFFKFTADITLPEEWTPIGSTSKRFAGSINGDGHLLTVPKGEKALLGATENAVLKNLNIFGEKIVGNGVVSIYTTGSSKPCITIENVTLKSGTMTTGSGFISGYASGSHPVTIRNCTVEQGVEIGDGTASNIGSFGGDFNGSIIGCVSHATVKGIDFVGGICGNKGQSMGDYVIADCIFDGTVVASGNYAGGISGGGYGGTVYGLASAPNTPCVTIVNCLCSGNITGSDFVGGILGAEPGVKECWNNGVGYIQSNLFTGTVNATGESASVGGVIGYLSSLDKVMIISDNYYLDSSANKGIGKIKMIETPETSGSFGTGFNKYTLSGAKYGRTDDPEGNDAEKLTKAVTAEELTNGTVLSLLNAGKNSSANWTSGETAPVFPAYEGKHLIRISCTALNTSAGMSQYFLSGSNVLEGKMLTLLYNDGSTETVSATDSSVQAGYNVNADLLGKYIPASLTVDGHELVFILYIKPDAPVLKEGISAEETVYVPANETFSIDLNTVFSDPNGLEIGYEAKLPGSKKYTEIETDKGVYSYTPEEPGTFVFTFRAKNSGGNGATYKLTLVNTVEISITVSNRGLLAKAADGSAMVNKTVTVQDLDADGKFTVHEALIAAHDAYNSAEGYVASDDYGYGLSVSKLWGADTMNTLFFINGTGLSMGVGTDTVAAGDKLLASVNADDLYYADWYTAFDKATASVTAGEELTLTLTGGQGMGYPADFSYPVKNVKIGTFNNGTFEQLGTAVTGDDGQVTLSFPTAGTYLVTASGTVKDQVVTDWTTYATEEADCPIIAPACIVTVFNPYVPVSENISVTFTLLGDSLHGEPAGEAVTHTLKAGTLTNWVSAKTLSLNKGATVKDALEKVLRDAGASCANPSGNYVESITFGGVTLGEFDNGNLSGWMYTLNGNHPDLGVAEQKLSDGDVIVFHYTDDYTVEEGSEQWHEENGKEESAVGTPDAAEKITLPAEAGKVPVIVKEDGSETVVKKSFINGDTVEALVPAGATVKLVDAQAAFTDVAENDWFADAVEFVAARGLFQGIGDDLFAPDATMTRSMLVTVLYRLEDEPAVEACESFTDVTNGSWYEEAVAWASTNHIVEGLGDGTFAPDMPVTREQIAVILYRYAKYLKMDVTPSGAGAAAFTDADEISDWAKDAFSWSAGCGLFRGDDTGRLNPKGEATRAEVAALLMRMVEQIVK